MIDNKYLTGNNFFIDEEIDEDFCDNFIPALVSVVNENENEVLNFWINSFGGLTHGAFQIIDVMEIAKTNGIIINTIVNYAAGSAGSMIAIAGSPEHRFISKRGWHLVHYGTISGEVATPLQGKRMLKRWDHNFSSMFDLYKTYTNIPNLEESINDDEFMIAGQQCIDYGLADRFTTEWVIDQ